jgi:anti-anti-sigma factor
MTVRSTVAVLAAAMSKRPSFTTLHGGHLGSHSRLLVRSARHGSAQFIELVGELDIEGAPHARSEVGRALAADRQTIVLDLGGLTFMDSSGVHMIIEAHQHLSADARQLVIARAPAHVRRLLDLCGLTPVLRLTGADSPRAAAQSARRVRVTQAAMAAAVRAMRSLDRQRLHPPR